MKTVYVYVRIMCYLFLLLLVLSSIVDIVGNCISLSSMLFCPLSWPAFPQEYCKILAIYFLVFIQLYSLASLCINHARSIWWAIHFIRESERKWTWHIGSQLKSERESMKFSKLPIEFAWNAMNDTYNIGEIQKKPNLVAFDSIAPRRRRHECALFRNSNLITRVMATDVCFHISNVASYFWLGFCSTFWWRKTFSKTIWYAVHGIGDWLLWCLKFDYDN